MSAVVWLLWFGRRGCGYVRYKFITIHYNIISPLNRILCIGTYLTQTQHKINVELIVKLTIFRFMFHSRKLLFPFIFNRKK